MKIQYLLIGLVLCLLPVQAAESPRTAHEFIFISIDGDSLPLAQFAGKALLVVNTASLCGFTHQYEGLQAVWQAYRGRGLVVLGVPSNDFLNQEPGSEAEIKKFCEVNFSVDFPMTSKIHVKGDQTHPFYVWARQQAGAPQWNFHKYLISPQGHIVAAYPSKIDPMSAEIREAIEGALPSDIN